MKPYILILFLLITVLNTGNLTAEPTISYELIKPEEIYIGTRLNLRVIIESPDIYDVYHPVRDTIGIFAVIDIRKDSITPEDSRKIQKTATTDKTTVINYILAPFETGRQRIAPLTFDVFNTTTDETERLSTPPFFVEVISVLPDSTSSIKDIAPPLKVRYSFWDYALPSLIIILIALLVYFIIKKMRKPLLEQLPDIEADTRPAYIKALELLEQLKAKKLLEKGEYIDYHYHISIILRIFLELQYKFRAVEMTTSEIREELERRENDTYADTAKSLRVKVTKYNEILDLLNYADMVKFAKFVPNVNKSLYFTDWLEKYLKTFASIHNTQETEDK